MGILFRTSLHFLASLHYKNREWQLKILSLKGCSVNVAWLGINQVKNSRAGISGRRDSMSKDCEGVIMDIIIKVRPQKRQSLMSNVIQSRNTEHYAMCSASCRRSGKYGVQQNVASARKALPILLWEKDTKPINYFFKVLSISKFWYMMLVLKFWILGTFWARLSGSFLKKMLSNLIDSFIPSERVLMVCWILLLGQDTRW